MAQTTVTCTQCGRIRYEKHMEQASFSTPRSRRQIDTPMLGADAYRTPANAWRCMARTSCDTWRKNAKKHELAKTEANAVS